MAGESDTRGKIAVGCFFTFWCVAAFGIGIHVLRIFPFESSTAPLILEIVLLSAPFFMGFLGLCIGVSILRARRPSGRAESVYPPQPTVYTGDYVSQFDMSEPLPTRKPSYQVPSECPSCGASLVGVDVEWVGPLEAKCPYCGSTIPAEEH